MINILGIETSCDETAASIVQDGRTIKSNVVYSQMDIHKEYGGVVPEIASRKHVEVIKEVVEKALQEAGMKPEELDGIAVTEGPGLVGPLLVGLSFAKAFSYALGKPLYGVNHLDGHICANFLAFEDLEPPFLALIVSGGHSHFYEVLGYGEYKALGGTRDDALGEAFDKVARLLSLPYPGGPNLERLAESGEVKYEFPMSMLEDDSLDFSFSGVKSAIRNFMQKEKITEEEFPHVAASFQSNVINVVSEKIRRALKQTGHKKLIIAGGVASNKALRRRLDEMEMEVYYPPIHLCTDNAAMIASAGFFAHNRGKTASLELNAKPQHGGLST